MNQILVILTKIRPEADFTASNDYIKDGLLDSFDIVTLVSDLDSTFGISIPGTEIVPENFCNAEAIAGLVAQCQKKP